MKKIKRVKEEEEEDHVDDGVRKEQEKKKGPNSSLKCSSHGSSASPTIFLTHREGRERKRTFISSSHPTHDPHLLEEFQKHHFRHVFHFLHFSFHHPFRFAYRKDSVRRGHSTKRHLRG
jgi:hypothetical protein